MVERRQWRKRIGRLILLIFCAGIVVFIGQSFFIHKPTKVISPIPEAKAAPKKPLFSFFQRKKSSSALADKINNAIGNTWSDYSVYVEDYNSDFQMGLSETEIFTAASVNKVPILAGLYYQAQGSAVDLDKDITLQQEEIQDYGTGSLRYAQPGTVYSIKTLARLMIKQSDNTAAYILANEIIGMDTLQNLVKQWGLTQTDIVNNKTSNKDMAVIFRKIYEEKIANKANTEEMLSFLKDTDFETRLPANLPEGVAVYHKIGSEAGIVHDAGIVTDKNHAYYIGIFTNDETDDGASEKLIAKISKIVYDYMQ
jgi:beta-lactamase class A